MKRKTGIALIAILSLLTFGLSACQSKSAIKKVTVVGSTALQPLVEQAAQTYQNTHQNVNITVQGGGSGTGLSQVQEGAVTVGNSDVFAEQQSGVKAHKLVDHQVAVVGIVPVVNKDVGVTNVSMTQLQQIFTGKLTNWRQLGGKNIKITIINRAQGSGTRKTFEDTVLKKKTPIKSQEQEANGTVQKIVANTPGAISYVAFSYVNNQIKALKIDHVTPNSQNVTTNRWQLWSYEHMYTLGQPNQTTTRFLNYIQSEKVQTQVVNKMGYISIHDMQVKKDQHNVITPK